MPVPNVPVPSRLLAALVAVMGLGTAPAAMAQAELLGDHSAWSAYTTETDSGRICFVMSAPTATSPQGAVSGDANFYITHRMAASVRSEPNLVAGYAFAPESTATLTVGEQSYTLSTAGEGAWLADPAQSASVVSAMRAGATMSVTGTSEAGNQVTQTFSLSGVTAATNQIDGAC